MQKKLLHTTAVFLMITTIFGHLNAQQGTRVAAVDPQGIVMASDEWRDMMDTTQKEFQSKAEALQKQEEAFNKKKNEADRSAIKEIAKEQKDIEIEKRAFEMELQQAQQQLQASIGAKVESAIQTVAKEDNWDLVQPKTFYVCKECDITQKVVDCMNKEYKKVKSASKFKKA